MQDRSVCVCFVGPMWTRRCKTDSIALHTFTFSGVDNERRFDLVLMFYAFKESLVANMTILIGGNSVRCLMCLY